MSVPIHWSFLQHWSPERAWWFGVFLGDGSAPITGDVVQCTGAFSTITRWRALITSDERPLYEHKHSPGTFVAKLRSHALSDWMLQVHGYRGPKSATLRWPEDLPIELYAHFIRGLWDSDGCLYLQDAAKRVRSGNPARAAIYTSIAVPFVERLAVAIEQGIGLAPTKLATTVVPQTGNQRAQLRYTGTQAHTLARWLYGDAPEHMRNEERMDVWRQFKVLQERLDAACACGVSPKYADDKCRACWQAAQPRITGAGTLCTRGCGRPIVASGLCNACRRKDHRAAHPATPKGTCACGSPAFKTDPRGEALICHACYERRRRGVPTRFELPTPPGGWKSRAHSSTVPS